MTVFKYKAAQSIDIAGDISWGHGVSGNGQLASFSCGLRGLRDMPVYTTTVLKY